MSDYLFKNTFLLDLLKVIQTMLLADILQCIMQLFYPKMFGKYCHFILCDASKDDM